MTASHTLGVLPRPLPELDEGLAAQLDVAVEVIRANQRFLVAAHHGPDGDAIGSTLALTHLLRELGKQAHAFNRDGVPYNFRFLPGADDVVTDPAEANSSVDVLVVLDCCSLERVHPDIEVDSAETKVLCIDHHATFNPSFTDHHVHDASASSVGEILYRLVCMLQVPLSPTVAEGIYAAVLTDTGSFRYSNTSPAALHVASEVVRAGVDVWRVSSEIYENHPPGRVKLLAEVLETLEVSESGRIAFITIRLDMYERTGTGPEMVDGFINYARGIRGVEVACQLRQTDADEFRVSFRSRGRVDVSALAQRFGGGGHRNAAGCRIQGRPASIIEELTATVDAMLGTR